MACKSCASEKQQNFSGEFSVAFRPIKKLNLAPVNFIQKIVVCLDSGYAELFVPKDELDQLRKGV